MLLRAEDEETGRPLTGHQICSEILTLAGAGTETTASVLSWILYELARHPDIEARVLSELHDVLDGSPVAFDDLSRLPYLNRVITEATRLHHTGWLVTRRTATQTRIGQWTLPPDPELAYCQHALRRDPEHFPDPLTFNPDRWVDSAPPESRFPLGQASTRASETASRSLSSPSPSPPPSQRSPGKCVSNSPPARPSGLSPGPPSGPGRYA